MSKEMNFGEALEALSNGEMLQRKGWNGKGMFVFRQVPNEVEYVYLRKMSSLPEKVKKEFISRGENINYKNQFAIVDKENNIQGWSPSVSDTQAKDWGLYKEDKTEE